MNIRIDASAFLDQLEDLGAHLDREAQLGMQNATELVAQRARALAPRGATLELSRNIEALAPTGRLTTDTLEGGVMADTEYAASIELGSRPHEIRARRARMLRFAVGGSILFRKRVMHPGTSAQDFLQRAVEMSIGDVSTELLVACERAIARAGF